MLSSRILIFGTQIHPTCISFRLFLRTLRQARRTRSALTSACVLWACQTSRARRRLRRALESEWTTLAVSSMTRRIPCQISICFVRTSGGSSEAFFRLPVQLLYFFLSQVTCLICLSFCRNRTTICAGACATKRLAAPAGRMGSMARGANRSPCAG